MYFRIGIASGELAGGIELIGAGQGMTAPPFPKGLGDLETRGEFLYFLCLILWLPRLLLLDGYTPQDLD